MNKHNSIIIKLRKYIRQSEFHQPGRNFYMYLINNVNIILKTKIIKLDIFKSEKERAYFIKNNRLRINISDDVKNTGEYIINNDYCTQIFKFLNEYKKTLEIINDSKPSAEQQYVNAVDAYDDEIDEEGYAIEIDDGYDYIRPTEKTTYMDVLQNLFINNEVVYKFNEDISESDIIEKGKFVKTVSLKITGKAQDAIIPTRYDVVCRAHVENGECLNNVSYFQGHFSSTIKCTLNNSDESGHTIKNPDKQIPAAYRTLYGYTAKLDGQDIDEQLIILSLIPIEKDLFKCNYLFIKGKFPYIMILGIKYIDDDENPLTENIILHDKTKKFFIDDIYESVKVYYKKYHNYSITEQNQIVAWFIIIQLITNIILEHRYHGMYIGKSGSGKTFFGDILVPMFTFNYANVLGTMMTRNRFLGGRSNITSEMFNTHFVSGFVHTRDVVVIDEATEKLDNYSNPKVITEQNLFTWMKMVDQKINLGIQGSFESTPKASIILFGNLEQLNTLRDLYTKKLKSKYKSLSNGKALKSYLPIYKAPRWYKEDGDDDLGRAHAIIRGRYYNSSHYITNLPEAEMARYTFFVALEDAKNGYKKHDYSGNFRLKRNVHRAEFVDELKEIFKDADFNTIDRQFIEDINEWLNNYLEFNDNNYRFSTQDDVNTHVFNNLRNMIVDIIWLNKLYYNKKIKFTDDDKIIIEKILRYNYNSLDKKEANMSSEPYINNMHFAEVEVELYENQRQEDYKAKLLQQEHSLDIPLNDELQSNGFGELPKNEFD